jgi:hypothetical protein
MQHLPPQSRLREDLNTYSAWSLAANGAPTRLGNLEYDEDTREGRLMATTPLSGNFTVRITAEPDVNVGAPGDIIVAERRIEDD